MFQPPCCSSNTLGIYVPLPGSSETFPDSLAELATFTRLPTARPLPRFLDLSTHHSVIRPVLYTPCLLSVSLLESVLHANLECCLSCSLLIPEMASGTFKNYLLDNCVNPRLYAVSSLSKFSTQPTPWRHWPAHCSAENAKYQHFGVVWGAFAFFFFFSGLSGEVTCIHAFQWEFTQSQLCARH